MIADFHLLISRTLYNKMKKCSPHDVSEANSEVVSNNSVHSDLIVCTSFVSQDDADSLLSLLSLENHGIASSNTRNKASIFWNNQT